MKLMILGAGGQVGSALCRLEWPVEFEVLGLTSGELDIGDPLAVREAFLDHAPDFIINAAAYTAVDKAESEPELAKRVNVKGPGYLAEAAVQKGIPIIHYSTDYVFDGSKHGAYLETDPVAPLGVYGTTKLEGERIIQAFNPSHIILRTSWVFGLQGANFPKTILRLAAERPEIGVVADQVGCPTFAGDIANATRALILQYQLLKTLPWGVYHYCSDEPCSWFEFARDLLNEAAKMGLCSTPLVKPLTTAQYPTLAKRPLNSRLDCTFFNTQFPQIPLSNWRKGMFLLIKGAMKG